MSARRPPLTLALCAALAALVALAASCSGPAPQDQADAIRLTAWVSYNPVELVLFKQLAEEFTSAWNKTRQPPLVIEVGQVPFQGLLPKLKTATQTHTTPDICRVDCAHVVPLAFGRALAALDEQPSFREDFPTLAAVRQEYVEAAIDSNLVRVRRDGRWEEHLFGLPDQTNCVALFRNKTLFQAAGDELRAAGLDPERAPRTWAEFLSYGQILSRPEKQQYAFGMDNSLWWSLPFFNSWGQDMVAVDERGHTRCVLNGADGVAALQFKVDLFRRTFEVAGRQVRLEAGAWIPGAVAPDTGFTNNHYAMIFSGPWNTETFARGGLDFAVSTLPEGPAGPVSNVGGTNMVVFRSCRYPDVAYRFLRWLTSTPVQARWCTALRQIPVVRGAFPLVKLEDRPDLAVFFQQILHAKARPRIPSFEALEQLINPEMELALKGVKTPKQALDDAVARIDAEVLAEMNE